MTDKEKVIRGLVAHNFVEIKPCNDCPYFPYVDCEKRLAGDALALLKRSFTPQEVYETVIERAQHDKRFKLGDKINYSFTDVVDILNIEMMCKAGDM